MRILFLSRWLPFPADNGSKIRILNLIRTLAERHEVILMAFSSEDEQTRGAAVTALRECCVEVQVIPYRSFRPASPAALRGFFSPQPRNLVDTFSQPMASAISALRHERPVDVVVASELDMMPYASLSRVPALLEDLEVATYSDAFVAATSLPRRLRAGLTWLKLCAYLRRELPSFAACTVVSERERDLVRRAVPAYDRVAVIPNAVDLESFRGEFGRPVADTIVHAGALSYSANLDAMGYFLADIFPGVRAAADRVLLRVTGTAPPAALAALPRSPGVEFTGYLADVRPTIAQSWASVVPLRRGGGTRLKILESMALGTPVVATPKGAEGLDVADGQELLIGADPGAFARAVIALLQSPDLRARLARAGRRRVETTYNWREVGRDLCPLVEGMEPGRTPRTRRALPEPAIPAAGSVARGER